MKVYSTKDIRNIVLLGHSGCGKTTMAETMLFEAGSISRRGTVEEGNTVSDHYNVEKERGNSVFSSLMHVAWKDSKINIIDTPGYDDFVGEVVSALKVADTAVMILNATQGVEVGTELVWEYTERFKTPLIFAVNQLDHEKSNFDNTVDQAKSRFGNRVTVVQYPYNAGIGFNAIIDVLKMVMYVFPEGGGKPEKQDIPESEVSNANDLHEKLVETIAEFDETLMEAYFETGALTEEQMTKGLKLSMLNHRIFPLFCVSSINNMGSGRIMGFLHDVAPAPVDRPYLSTDAEEIACAQTGAPVLFFYKTLSEPHLGEISYFKVVSGSVSGGEELTNARTTNGERFSQIYLLNGKTRINVDKLNAGDLGVVVKLKDTKTNDTLTKKGTSITVEPIGFPAPRIRAAIKPPSKNDLEKIMVGLSQLQKEDPTIVIEQSKELSQTIIHGQGEMHLSMIKYRLEKLYNVELDFIEPKIAYRETITKSCQTSYRHKKQSGGSGQFAEVHMLVEPYYDGMPPPKDVNVRSEQSIDLEWGGTLKFLWCIVGGSIDTKYQNAIIKGVMKTLENGPMTGSYARDIRISVYDGKMHAVDSNDMAFMLAASHCVKTAFVQAGPVILQPMYDIEVLCTNDVMGDIMSDLQSRNAMIMGVDADGHYQKIKARLPLRLLYKYSSTLRSLSQGRAKHTRKFADFAKVSREVQEQLINAHKGETVEA